MIPASACTVSANTQAVLSEISPNNLNELYSRCKTSGNNGQMFRQYSSPIISALC
jgi:hypothetical protein